MKAERDLILQLFKADWALLQVVNPYVPCNTSNPWDKLATYWLKNKIIIFGFTVHSITRLYTRLPESNVMNQSLISLYSLPSLSSIILYLYPSTPTHFVCWYWPRPNNPLDFSSFSSKLHFLNPRPWAR